jgi:hypothetical protein
MEKSLSDLQQIFDNRRGKEHDSSFDGAVLASVLGRL